MQASAEYHRMNPEPQHYRLDSDDDNDNDEQKNSDKHEEEVEEKSQIRCEDCGEEGDSTELFECTQCKSASCIICNTPHQCARCLHTVCESCYSRYKCGCSAKSSVPVLSDECQRHGGTNANAPASARPSDQGQVRDEEPDEHKEQGSGQQGDVPPPTPFCSGHNRSLMPEPKATVRRSTLDD
jgi:hypothetical protein